MERMPAHVMILLYRPCSVGETGKYGLYLEEAMAFHSDTEADEDPWNGVLEDECDDKMSLSVGVGRVPYGDPDASSGSLPRMRSCNSMMRLNSWHWVFSGC